MVVLKEENVIPSSTSRENMDNLEAVVGQMAVVMLGRCKADYSTSGGASSSNSGDEDDDKDCVTEIRTCSVGQEVETVGGEAGAEIESAGCQFEAGIESAGCEFEAGIESAGCEFEAGIESAGCEVEAGIQSAGCEVEAEIESTSHEAGIEPVAFEAEGSSAEMSDSDERYLTHRKSFKWLKVLG